MTVIASLNGLGLRLSGDGRRPLRTCSKPSVIWMPGRSRAVRPSSADQHPRRAAAYRLRPSEGEVGYDSAFAGARDGGHKASDSGAPRAARIPSTETATKRNASAAAEWASSAMGNRSPLKPGFRDHRTP